MSIEIVRDPDNGFIVIQRGNKYDTYFVPAPGVDLQEIQHDLRVIQALKTYEGAPYSTDIEDTREHLRQITVPLADSDIKGFGL